MAARSTQAEMQRTVLMGMRMIVRMVMTMIVRVWVIMHMAENLAVGTDMFVLLMVLSFDMNFARSASACRTHDESSYSTSNSLTRISVPPVACTW
jgi:hypothetical protein